MTRIITIFIMMFSFISLCFAKDVIKASGFAQIRLEDHMSKEEAREEAKQQAMINAIEEAFGAYVEKDSDIDIEDGKAKFKIIGHTLVRGDWLKTTKEKFDEEKRKIRGRHGKEDEIWISCVIEGMIREIKYPETTLNFTPLNCPDPVCRTYDFRVGEPFFLSFRTPVNGYLSVFLVDESNTAYRLLPYQAMPEDYVHAVPVTADIPYIFFLNEKDYDYFPGFSYMMIDEIVMSTDKLEEFLDLFIIFSNSDFKKPILDEVTESAENFVLPKSIGSDEFEDWLEGNRIYDPSFIYNRVTLTIKK